MSASILIIDDDPIFLRFCKRLLNSGKDFDVHTASNPVDALLESQIHDFDLILVDIDLRNDQMDGIGCVKELRSKKFDGAICMITADPSIEKITDAAIAGADDYWVKGTDENIRFEVENLLLQMRDPKTYSSDSFLPLRDGGHLRSRGLKSVNVETLIEYLDSGFQREKELAKILGTKSRTLAKRFSRIKEKLELSSLPQLSQLMTLLSIYSKRRNEKWGKN